MKNIKNILRAITMIGILVCAQSCKEDFLDEELTTSYSTEYFETEEGLNQLAISLYANIRYHFAYEWAYGFTNYGTDEFSTGTDLTSEMWNTYDSRLAPNITNAANGNFPAPEYLWDQMYFGINEANIIIQNADVIEDQNLYNKCVGEAYFLRGYNYLRLVEQFGGVVLNTTADYEVKRNYTRSTEEESLELIVSDLNNAYELLPEDEFRGKGTFTKPLAAHMLAKALLLRSSERNDDWNSSYLDADLTKIVTLSDYVIQTRPLAADYRDLWNWTGVDCNAEMLPEILMAAQFNADATTTGRYKNRTFCYPIAQYSNLNYMTRSVPGGLDFQRLRTLEYTCSVFDLENDSRFWKSFKTKYRVNNAPTNDYGIENGDLGIIYIINSKDDDRFDAGDMGPDSFSFLDSTTNKVVPHAFPNYANGEWVAQNWGDNRFVSLSKYEDGSRTALKDMGNRDGVLARTGETYLIKAEALVRQGNYQQALDVVNTLRERAQYSSGELREHHTDGSQAANGGLDESYDAYSNRNSYYESVNIPYTTDASDLQVTSISDLPQEDEELLSKLGVSGDYERMLHFILNERTRELCGEYLRWVDLSRTETLITRVKAFNSEASGNIDDHHLLRPIPQSFIDGLLHEDGTNLTVGEQDDLQNPGY
ncbi:MAG: RagB/SusD family nutrient uptake outer membrane protein [Thalassobius sp.]|nr:RagB/SusD family nutrient uptake outer membrane protein [Thalassovita sp.]